MLADRKKKKISYHSSTSVHFLFKFGSNQLLDAMKSWALLVIKLDLDTTAPTQPNHN